MKAKPSIEDHAPHRLWLIAMILALAFAFLGSRGIWDPDEGRYTNVAVNMLDSGDWLNPRRSHEVGHWTKPPMTYWAIASSVALFGKNPWAARLPIAVAYLLCTWLTGRIAHRIAPGTGTSAAVIYATMLLPFGVSQLITSDYILAACETLAVWAYVEARWGPGRSHHWMALMWVGLALAFLTKGPPALLPLLVILISDRMLPGKRRVFHAAGIVLFLLLALPWYVAVILHNPGLLAYFIGNEVVNRIATDAFGRHGQWYGWITIYVPTLVLGTLPWTPALWRWARTLVASLRKQFRDAAQPDGAMLLLTLWVLVPLVAFILARSRLPTYILPLFVPLAVLAAVQRRTEGRRLPGLGWFLGWAAILLALKLASAYWPTHKNAADWAAAIRARTSTPVTEVVFVEDMARYGLRLHLDAEVEKVSLAPTARDEQARFSPVNDEDVASELRDLRDEPGGIWVCKQHDWPRVSTYIHERGFDAIPLGAPYRQRIIFRTLAASGEQGDLQPPPHQ